MQRHSLIVFLALLPIALGAQVVRVSGIAWDSLHGLPLKDALVNIAGTSRSAFSDATGRFTIDSVAPGTYRFVMQHDVLDSIGMSGAVTRATVTDGASMVMIFVPSFETLWKAACFTPAPADSGLLFGTVRLRSGARVPTPAGVSASWVDVNYARGSGFSQHRWRMDAVTDSLGNYTLCGLPRATGIRIKVGLDTLTAESFDLLPMDRARVLRKDFLVNPAAKPPETKNEERETKNTSGSSFIHTRR
jgi:hypothetical protein